MVELDGVDNDELRDWLDHVERKETAQWLMMAIAHNEGVDVDTLSKWYDVSATAIREWFDELKSESVVIAVAAKEGVDVDDLAHQYGLSPNTIHDWLDELQSESIADAVDMLNRYSQERSVPVFRQTESVVTYLNYEVVEANGWSVEDDDLFEKASDAGIAGDDYGRIRVSPGETILEAAENRGFSWPYACRAGACANCAVLVKEGDIAMPGNHVLTDEQVEVLNARLTCVGVPVTSEVKLVMNVQHLDQFDDLRLPSPLAQAEWSGPA